MHRRMIRPDTLTTVVRLSRRETERVNGNITMATKNSGMFSIAHFDKSQIALFNIFMVVTQLLSTVLIPRFRVSLPNRHGDAVS